MKSTPDLKNKKFGSLFITEYFGKVGNKHFWTCICECGKVTEKVSGNLTSGNTKRCSKSCKVGQHPLQGSPTWKSWNKMLSRTRYKEYEEWHGDVTVCSRWDNRNGGSFANFAEDMGERPKGSTLNRINGAKVYSKETCEWASLSLQSFDQKMSKVNTSGRTGVSWSNTTNKWIATIKKNGKSKYLYSGNSFERACAAREKAEIEMYGFAKE